MELGMLLTLQNRHTISLTKDTYQLEQELEQEMEQQQEVRFDGKCVTRREQLVKATSKRGTSDW